LLPANYQSAFKADEVEKIVLQVRREAASL
jgi:hypothetical protein